MFTTAHPRVATPHGGTAVRDNLGTKARRIGAASTAIALGGAFALIAPLSASAAELPVSYAEAQFLSGTLLGVDLDTVVAVQGAEASNDGTQPTQTSKDPLSAEVLQTVEVEAAPAPQIDLGGVLQIGPVGQYAEAESNGSSFAATGAVTDDGVVGVGGDTSTPPADASLDLESMVGAEFASTLTDLDLVLSAISAQAQADLEVASGDYQIAGAELVFNSPAIADLTPKVDSALEEVENSLGELLGTGGDLIGDVNDLFVDLDPVLNLLGGGGNVSATIDVGDLQAAVHSILEDGYGDGAVSFDLETGDVRVDLAAFVGGDLNDLPPGTELLTDEVVDAILDSITTTIATIADQVVEKVEEALHDADVAIHADLSANIAQSPIVQEVCQLVDRVVTSPVLGDVGLLDALDLITDGLVGSLTDGLLDEVGDFVFDEDGAVKQIVGFVNTTVQDTVCSTQSTPVAPLTTGVSLDITATVDQLLNGVAANATANAQVLGIPADLDLDLLLDDLGDSLLDGLFDSDGAVQGLIDALDSTLVDPATEALLGDGVGTVGDALRDVLSVTANVQEIAAVPGSGGGEFTQTALRVSVLGDDLATLNLAQATVGPNVTQIVDCLDPDGCDVGGETTTPPGGGGGGGNLAFTGIGIATLIAVILALLAAGAYLVRESYRKTAIVR